MEYRIPKFTTTTTHAELQTLQGVALRSHQIPLDNNINYIIYNLNNNINLMLNCLLLQVLPKLLQDDIAHGHKEKCDSLLEKNAPCILHYGFTWFWFL